MNISIIGAGNVGKALTQALTLKGLKPLIGVNDPKKYQEQFAIFGEKAKLVSVPDAINNSDIIILAIPYEAAKIVAQSTPDWQNKILVDATNPLLPMLSGLSLGTTSSGAEVIASLARGARVVKAFNTTGAENMANPRYPTGLAMMPVCGDDPEARHILMDIAKLIGFDPVDMGGIISARYLEPFAMTWIHLAFKQGKGRSFAFSLMTR